MTAPAGDSNDSVQTAEPESKQTSENLITQTQLNKLLASQKREIESRFDGFDDIKSKAEQFDQLTETAKSDIQRFQEQLQATSTERDTVKSENSSLKTQLLRQKISAGKGLDSDLWDRVAGTTEEEITADVEKLVAKFQPTSRVQLGSRSGSGASAPDGRTEKQRAAAALRGLGT